MAKTAAETVVKTNRELFEANVKLQDENTRLVRTQKALKEAKKEAEEASKAKTQFLANISHEIRTPLNGIIGSLSLLLEDERDKEKLSSLKIINESSEVLLKLLNEILNFSKIESGNFDINLEPVNLYELQSETFDAFLSAAQQKNIALNSTCQIDPKHYFLGDALKIKQILNNLIANAIKFCDAGEVNINSLWQADTKTLVLTVSDTGIGIPEHQQNLIFSEFVQLDSTLKRRHEGAGLGLAITQRLVERMEGSIKLTSEVGKGSTFEITIPMESTNAPEPAIGKEESSEPETTLNILLVEDNKTNQLVISRLINKAGHEYTLAENGLERLEKMKHDQFDLILMDIMMPEMDGIEATREIRKIFSKDTLPILALSANTETENIEECLTVGMNEYLNKPIRMQELKSILNRYAPKLTAAESS
ncbi:signal transduction histidine kinase [Gynuella sunshinyii YC6258]|uniref:histidine kinase n=1 Tax=Gynuella sunshinyii YC6258 TaxID=1445510 RepID=A0A0C5VPU0_9GAMM|nr:signal transduction histidine kinase [Gynuella sunshinyii YC6258]